MANLIVTNGGIAAIRNAQATGTNAVRVASVRIGTGKWTPTGAATALKMPIKTYSAIAGGAIGSNVIHVEALDQSADAFTAYEVGVFLADGTMLAVGSSTTPILVKAAGTQAMLAVDIVISDIGTTVFNFPSASFLVPVATTEIQGIVELATIAEGLAGTDVYRAMTPADVKAVADTKANVNHASTATTYGPATGTNYGHTRLSDATGSSSSTSGGYAATPKAVKDAKEACIQADTYKVAKAGDTVTGAIHSTAGKSVVNGGSTEQFGGEMANSDKWRLAAGGTASDAGFVALDTADNGSEPILVRQYSGNYATLVRQAELLDASGDTSFPGEVTATGGFAGDLDGTARDATRLTTARNLTIKDNDQSNAGPAQSFNGTSNAVLRLPATIKASIDGNAKTATALQNKRKINGTDFDGTAAITTAKWGTARDLSIADADGSNAGAAVSVDGSAAKTLKLPATIKATLDGTAENAKTWKTARNFAVADATGSNTGATAGVNGSANVTLRLPATIKAEVDGNAKSASQLKTARKINGTSFNATADITTAKWGTSRNLSISDADGSNTGAAVAVDGSAAKTLKLPATIKASLNGNASSASKVGSKLTLKVNGGTEEGKSQYAFDGSTAKTVNLKAGANVSLTAGTGSVTFSATDTTYSAFGGAAESAAGTPGLVPAPSAGDQDKVLSGDGTWRYASSLPVGSIVMYAAPTQADDSDVPEGFLVCDGRLVEKTVYPDLYAAIGDTYAQDGDSAGAFFRLPDLQERFVEGAGRVPATGVPKTGQTLEAGLPNIAGGHLRLLDPGDRETESGGPFRVNQFIREAYFTSRDGWNGYDMDIDFDASWANPIYGKSDTVQPAAVQMLPIIKAYGAYANEGMCDCGALALAMQQYVPLPYSNRYTLHATLSGVDNLEYDIIGCTPGKPVIIGHAPTTEQANNRLGAWTRVKVKSGALMGTKQWYIIGGAFQYLADEEQHRANRTTGPMSIVIVPTATTVTIQLGNNAADDDLIYIYK